MDAQHGEIRLLHGFGECLPCPRKLSHRIWIDVSAIVRDGIGYPVQTRLERRILLGISNHLIDCALCPSID